MRQLWTACRLAQSLAFLAGCDLRKGKLLGLHVNNRFIRDILRNGCFSVLFFQVFFSKRELWIF